MAVKSRAPIGFNALTVRRTWDAATNTPTLVAGQGKNGKAYLVGTAGDTDLGQAGDWQVGDVAYFALDRWVRLQGGTAYEDKTIYDYGADGLGGATDLAALDAMLADLVANLPRLPKWAKSPIDVGATFIPGPAGTDPMMYLQKVYAAFDRAGLWHATFDYTGVRDWIFTTPPVSLGPQSQYLVPPLKSRHRWCDAEWDFSAYPSGSSATIFRRQGSYGPTIGVVGSIAAGSKTVTVGSGQAAGLKRGDRLLCRTTARQTDLVGAFTLVDAYNTGFAARAKSRTVKSVSGDVITFYTASLDTYDSSATPVLQLYVDEPEIEMVNPTFKGRGGDDYRAIFLACCRNARITGGKITDFGQAVRIFSSLGGHIEGLTILGSITPGNPGGGITIGDDTSDFVVRKNTLRNGSQMIMFAGSGAFYGITDNVTVENNWIYSPFNGISTHNLHWYLKLLNNNIFDASDDAIDIRCPYVLVRGGLIERCARSALVHRIASFGLTIDGLVARHCLSGIYGEDSASPAWDILPGGHDFRNLVFEDIGGTGSKGGVAMAMSWLVSGSPPTFGALSIQGRIAMNSNAAAIDIGGKWPSPKVTAIIEAAPGASPAGRSLVLDDSGNGAGNGPSNPVARIHQSATYATPQVLNTTGTTTLDTGIEGITSTRPVFLTGATTLIGEQSASAINAGIFSNSGAGALVEVTMPGASGVQWREFKFLVANANGFKLQAVDNDTFQLATGSPGAAGGYAQCTTKGERAVVVGYSGTEWVIYADNPANWTVA